MKMRMRMKMKKRMKKLDLDNLDKANKAKYTVDNPRPPTNSISLGLVSSILLNLINPAFTSIVDIVKPISRGKESFWVDYS